MSTIVYSKKRFLDWLDRNLNEQSIVLLTADLDGSISVSEKKNTKKVTFAFAADAFKRKGDVGHIAFGRTPVFSLSICNPDDVSDLTLKMLKKGDEIFEEKLKAKQ